MGDTTAAAAPTATGTPTGGASGGGTPTRGSVAFNVGEDGMLRLEMFESFDDVPGRGLHSSTSQLDLSRFGQRADLRPGCDKL
jgi:hypothetical protein